MLKWLLMGLALFVVGGGYWLSRRDAALGRTAAPKSIDAMVACAHCGVHVPSRDALVQGTSSYCSAAHRTAGPREQG